MVETRATSKIDSLATFAGRAGIAADRWFVFAKGGITAAHEKHDYRVDANLLVGGAPVVQTAESERFGNPLRADARLRRRICACRSVVDPRRIQLPSSRHRHGAAGGARPPTRGVATPSADNNRVEQAIHVVKLGVNYRFGGVAPDPSFAPVPAAPGTNWTGAYIGAQGGYGWGQTQWPDVFGVVAPGGSLPRFDNSGWLAGGTIGVNAQSGRFVFGVEGEILATGIKGSRSGSA